MNQRGRGENLCLFFSGATNARFLSLPFLLRLEMLERRRTIAKTGALLQTVLMQTMSEKDKNRFEAAAAPFIYTLF
jgi:hypothetical protein